MTSKPHVPKPWPEPVVDPDLFLNKHQKALKKLETDDRDKIEQLAQKLMSQRKLRNTNLQLKYNDIDRIKACSKTDKAAKACTKTENQMIKDENKEQAREAKQIKDEISKMAKLTTPFGDDQDPDLLPPGQEEQQDEDDTPANEDDNADDTPPETSPTTCKKNKPTCNYCPQPAKKPKCSGPCNCNNTCGCA
jgi:hypothetical protein